MVYHINFIDFSIILSFFFVEHPKSDAREKVSYITTQINKKKTLFEYKHFFIDFLYFCYIEKYKQSTFVFLASKRGLTLNINYFFPFSIYFSIYYIDMEKMIIFIRILENV